MGWLLILEAIFFCAGLVLLAKGAGFFVAGATGLALRWKVSKTLMGFTIVAFGTTLPEFVVNVNALVMNTPEISLGNVLGSCAANIALIMSLCAILKPAAIQIKGRTPWWLEWAIMILATLLFCLLAFRGIFDPFAGAVLLAAFVCALYFLLRRRRHVTYLVVGPSGKSYREIVGGLAAVIVGSTLVVENALFIAHAAGIDEFVIGLSLVAIGTSLPELSTAITAVIRGEGEISVGNLMGANIFNLLFVMGTGTFIRPIPVNDLTDVWLVVVFSFLVLPLFRLPPYLARLWASGILLMYGFYIGSLFGIV